MPSPSPRLRGLAVITVLAGGALGARAQGLPVIDVANLMQAVQQVLDDATLIDNQVQQILQLRLQVQRISGSRGLGDYADDPGLHNYIPAQAYTALNAVHDQGYAGLTATARSLRDADMVYNCAELGGAARTACQATLAAPYQQRGLLQDAMRSAAARVAQIENLMSRVNATDDQKSVLEMQARLAAENALLAHEATQLQMLQGLADSDERIARARDRERQYEALGRRGRLAEHLR